MQPSAAVYVTYVRKEDATKAIYAVDGSVMAGRILRYIQATFTFVFSLTVLLELLMVQLNTVLIIFAI